jgi:hypothetical protein
VHGACDAVVGREGLIVCYLANHKDWRQKLSETSLLACRWLVEYIAPRFERLGQRCRAGARTPERRATQPRFGYCDIIIETICPVRDQGLLLQATCHAHER